MFSLLSLLVLLHLGGTWHLPLCSHPSEQGSDFIYGRPWASVARRSSYQWFFELTTDEIMENLKNYVKDVANLDMDHSANLRAKVKECLTEKLFEASYSNQFPSLSLERLFYDFRFTSFTHHRELGIQIRSDLVFRQQSLVNQICT